MSDTAMDLVRKFRAWTAANLEHFGEQAMAVSNRADELEAWAKRVDERESGFDSIDVDAVRHDILGTLEEK